MAFLTFLREGDHLSYEEFALGEGSVEAVLKALASRPGGAEYLRGRTGSYLEGILLRSTEDRTSSKSRIEQYAATVRSAQSASTDSSPNPDVERANRITDLLKHLSFDSGVAISLPYITNRIEMAFGAELVR